MNIPRSSSPWQPLTFGGVAAFASGSWGRLLKVQTVVALVTAASVVWFLASAWFPEVEIALRRLPERGRIQRGALDWPSPAPARLVEGIFLSVTVDPQGVSETGGTADIQLVLRRNEVRLGSLLGYASLAYPKGWSVALGRTEVQAWWGAWQTALLAGVAAATVVGSIMCWLSLGLLYSFPVKFLTLQLDREATWGGCWRLAGAAVLPGALVLSGALVLYSFRRLDLVGLLFAWLLHLFIGWIYAAIVPFRLPRIPDANRPGGNPFGSSSDAGSGGRLNPFASRR